MFGAAGIFGGAGRARDRRAWPVLMVVLAAALVPAGCVLWFMNVAMRNERLAIRQRLVEVYREHMSGMKERIEGDWAQRRAAIEAAAGMPPAEAFGKLVGEGVVDGAVIFDAEGKVAYPAGVVEPEVTADPNGWDEAVELEQAGEYAPAADAYDRIASEAADRNDKARAMQARARLLVRLGQVDDAVKVLRALGAAEYQESRDESGRLIGPGALLYALKLLPRAELARTPMTDELGKRLADYSGPAMSSAQRRLLLGELEEVAGVTLPALAGENWTAAYLGGALRGIFEIRSRDGRVIGLCRPETIKAVVRSGSAEVPRVELYNAADWEKAPEPLVSLSMGDTMPGWRLATYLPEGAAHGGGKVALYLWAGATGVLLTAGAMLAAGGYVSRQMAVTRLKNDLIATVSHELKTPVASTRMLVETLLEDGDGMPDKAKEYLQLIARENNRLARLIENFLTFSRMERDGRAFDMTVVEMADVARLAADVMAERFAGPTAKLTLDIPKGLALVKGDRDALVTAVVNLLDNAHKYTGERKEVGLSIEAQSGDVIVRVRDNGIGLSRAEASQVFERFYQADRTLSRRAGGCGLGLSIVKLIVESHGGSVSLSSKPGEGSCFTIRLPLLRPEEAVRAGR